MSKVHFSVAGTLKTACGKKYLNCTRDFSKVTCVNCLKRFGKGKARVHSHDFYNVQHCINSLEIAKIHLEMASSDDKYLSTLYIDNLKECGDSVDQCLHMLNKKVNKINTHLVKAIRDEIKENN